MRNKLFILFACLDFMQVRSQASGGFEQLYYMRAADGAAMVPMAHYTTKNNWYGEARYNYDEAQTFAVYAGRTFSKKEISPILPHPLSEALWAG